MKKNIFETIASFAPSELTLIEEHCIPRTLRKDEILLGEGEICRSAYFILSGSFYQYRLRDTTENVIDLHIENEWFLNSTSFISQKPSDTIIKAHAESEILELTVHSIHKLISLSPVYLQLGRLLEPATSCTKFFDEGMTPAEKYN
jgi:CRP-like cAMP-binding protein